MLLPPSNSTIKWHPSKSLSLIFQKKAHKPIFLFQAPHKPLPSLALSQVRKLLVFLSTQHMLFFLPVRENSLIPHASSTIQPKLIFSQPASPPPSPFPMLIGKESVLRPSIISLRYRQAHPTSFRELVRMATFIYRVFPWLDGRCVQGPGTYSPQHD